MFCTYFSDGVQVLLRPGASLRASLPAQGADKIDIEQRRHSTFQMETGFAIKIICRGWRESLLQQQQQIHSAPTQRTHKIGLRNSLK